MSGNHLNFWSLPSDTLQAITSYISGLDVFALCNCGNRLLLSKLMESGAVKKFRLEYGADIVPRHSDWRVQNWGTLRRFQSLEHIEFANFERVAFRTFTTMSFKGLNPQNLRIIRFQFIEAQTLWVDLELSLGESERTPRMSSEEYLVPFNLGQKFPNLEELTLRTVFWDNFSVYSGRAKGTYGWKEVSKIKFLKQLPKNLTKLQFWAGDIKSDLSGVLPPYLQSLTITGDYFGNHHAHRVDPFIQSLTPEGVSLDRFDSIEVDHSSIGNTKGTQTSSSAIKNRMDIDSPQISNEEVYEGFPHTLNSLTLEFLSNVDILSLPRSLTYLSVQRINKLSDKVEFFGLPSTLKVLNIFSLDYFYSRMVPELPKGLDTLKIVNSRIAIKDAACAEFPRTLTNLQLGDMNHPSCAFTSIGFFQLPTSLTSLSISNITGFPWSILEGLPRGMKVLSIARMVPSTVPGKESLDNKASFDYYKSLMPTGCKLVCLDWNYNPPPTDQHAPTADLDEADEAGSSAPGNRYVAATPWYRRAGFRAVPGNNNNNNNNNADSGGSGSQSPGTSDGEELTDRWTT